MPVTGVRLHGVREAIDAFKKIEPTMRKECAEATRSTLMTIATIARQRVRVRSGALRDAIDYTFSPVTGTGRVGIRAKTVTLPSGQRVNTARYAHLIEFGSSQSDAYPFMVPAAESQRSQAVQRWREALRRGERQLANVGGRFV